MAAAASSMCRTRCMKRNPPLLTVSEIIFTDQPDIPLAPLSIMTFIDQDLLHALRDHLAVKRHRNRNRD